MMLYYYPFGQQHPDRCWQSTSYRYGFNGMEKDDEVKGVSGTSYDFGARIYDPRVSRFLSVDPLTVKFAFYSPYLFAGNKPVLFIDRGGFQEGPGLIIWTDMKSARNAGWTEQQAYELHQAAAQGRIKDAAIGLITWGVLMGGGTAAPYAANTYYYLTNQYLSKPNVQEGVKDAVWGMASDAERPTAAGAVAQTAKKVGTEVAEAVGEVGTEIVEAAAAKIEDLIVNEAKAIISSPQLKELWEAFIEGVSKTVVVGKRTIQVEPSAPFSGLAFDGGVFVLGKEAFATEEELTITVLHELHRLHTSVILSTGKASQAAITEETKNAASFANEAYEKYFEPE